MESKAKAKKSPTKPKTTKASKKTVSIKPKTVNKKKKSLDKPAMKDSKKQACAANQTDAKETNDVVVLVPNLSLGEVTDLRKALARSVDGSTEVKIDASAVQSASTASMQLLLSFVQHVSTLKSVELIWVGVSEAFIDAATLLGIAEPMNINKSEDSPEEDDDLCPVF
ncbi:MAG: STAS domain-containing protein [Pseudomonadota bacterium]